MGQQRYTDEFRREAVRQVIEKGHAVKDVAERLGVSSWSLYEWLRKARAGSGPGARLANKDEEIRRLRGELKRVTEERNILKKAAVGSRGRCNAMNDHSEEGSWIVFVGHACQSRRRRSYGSGGSAVSRSATSVGHWVASRERFTTLSPPAGVSHRSHAPGHNVRSA